MAAKPSLVTHHPFIVDGVTKGCTTSQTDLAALYDYTDDSGRVDNTFLKNVTRLSEPAVRCILETKDGKLFPGSSGYKLYFRYNKLLYAPCARLECDLSGHTISLEFHFNKCGSKQLRNFTQTSQEYDRFWTTPISFSANGATCEGFNNVSNIIESLTEGQKAIYTVLRDLIDLDEAQPLTVHLVTGELREWQKYQLRQIQKHLPGGNGPLFPSIGKPEYSCFNTDSEESLQRPFKLMSQPLAPPMVPLAAGDTFSSLGELQAHHLISTTMQDWEGQTQLRQFSKAHHKATVFKVEKYAVIAVKFGNIPLLGSSNASSKFRLPNELEVDMKFRMPGGAIMEHKAHLETQPMGLPPHDAFFVATRPLSWFGKHANDPSEDGAWYTSVLEFRPHQNSFLFSSQKDTIVKIAGDKYKAWHAILLNQLHDSVEKIDVISDLKKEINPEVVDRAFRWLREGCKIKWHPDQLKVIDSMRCAPGRLILCSGIAGTGKTSLQVAMATSFVMMGGRALVTATANSNADHAVKSLAEFKDVFKQHNLRVYRIYSASRNAALKEMTAQQVANRQVGHHGGKVSSLESFRFEMLAKKKKIGAMEFSVLFNVLKEADQPEEHRLVYMTTLLGNKDDKGSEQKVDAWEFLRGHLNLDRRGKFDWEDTAAADEYRKSFDICQGHLLRIADIIIITDGNAKADEIDQWAMGPMAQGKPLKALGVFCDEAAKEQEVNLLNVITAKLPRQPDLYVFFGDEKQMGPVNTCASGKFQFNHFNSRLDTSLFTRLLNQGFPNVHLTEQQRMHPVLSRFPSKEFYGNALTNSPKVDRPLEAVKPGLSSVLHGIIADSFGSPENSTEYLERSSDDQARLHYIEMPISEADVNGKGSVAFPGHINIFFEKIFPALQAYFGEETEENVMLIVGYTNAIKRYEEKFYDLRKAQHLPHSHYPRILTIDSAQGQESTMVVMDGSMQYRNRLGFMKDPGRCNVAMTRAREVFWILGGPLTSTYLGVDRDPLTPFPKLRQDLLRTGQVHQFS